MDWAATDERTIATLLNCVFIQYFIYLYWRWSEVFFSHSLISVQLLLALLTMCQSRHLISCLGQIWGLKRDSKMLVSEYGPYFLSLFCKTSFSLDNRSLSLTPANYLIAGIGGRKVSSMAYIQALSAFLMTILIVLACSTWLVKKKCTYSCLVYIVG